MTAVTSMTRAFATLLLLAGLFISSAPAHAADAAATDEAAERVMVTDPYLEFHTGPGRGYPIFFVAAREEWVEILMRHTDWFKVRSAKGRVGWVERQQLATTLTQVGGQKTFRDIALDDYLKRRLELGAAWGHFKTEPMLKMWAGYKLTDTLSLETTLGQVQGIYSGTDFWHLNLVTEPWSDQRLSPFFSIGFGKFHNIPNASLVGAISTDAKLANASIGVRYHISDRFIARTDYTIYNAYVSDARSTEYRAVTAGLSFFF
jgi:hypothetical protein